MPLKRVMKGIPSNITSAEGYLCQDWEALTACQRECSHRFGKTIQIEQEAYLTNHPEVRAMLEIFVSKMVRGHKRKSILREAAEHFSRSPETLDMEIRDRLGLPSTGSYLKPHQQQFHYKDRDLEPDLINIINTHYGAPAKELATPSEQTIDTESSSFLSILTSTTTLPTPEPIPTPPPTLSQHLFALVSNTVDKAIFLHVDDSKLRYDTAYVELVKAVEAAMEIPVIEIREDIAQLLYNSYRLFEMVLMEKERIEHERLWEKRMRKKLKRTLRRVNNFKGYESPPTPKSDISSHESYKVAPPRPCTCAPQFKYNRYPKDRFGIYLPSDGELNAGNITVTPALSLASITSESNKIEFKSSTFKKNISKTQ